ncbi:hypothetical protein BDBG_07160 [Blastomyces gilchristii SLH14081]|uniref:Uncharacterized protein n=1 Tax=Blastomyces gilchristii (strain SLH14081) TaxID=559298 RepID=A0A179UXE3_BLAGS|nr:uncharacterized protein BDBG_07160 [Blastomyces gilchristii SLH14081]OAT11721.1 hypothetical protein BDBG_07160 [Blastomyces gilchristii SLH14081]
MEESEEEQQPSQPEHTQHRMVAVEIPTALSSSPLAFNRHLCTGHDEEANKQPMASIRDKLNQDRNEYRQQ